jgi:oxygen-independent coproporphyrinogen-3 oxidase
MEAVVRGAGSHRQTEAVRDEDLGFEFMMNALRLVEGIEPSRYGEQTGRPLEDLLGGVTRARALGLMEQREGIWRPTTRGLDLLSDLQILFMHQKKAERPKIVRIQAQ